MRRPRRLWRARRRPPAGHHRQGADRAAAGDPGLAAAGLLPAAAHAGARARRRAGGVRPGSVGPPGGPPAGGRSGSVLAERPVLTSTPLRIGRRRPVKTDQPGEPECPKLSGHPCGTGSAAQEPRRPPLRAVPPRTNRCRRRRGASGAGRTACCTSTSGSASPTASSSPSGKSRILLGASLPAEALSDLAWWGRTTVVATDAHCSDAWVLANRTAHPNLQARTVIFDRIS